MLTTYAAIKVIHQLVLSVGCSFTSLSRPWIGASRRRSVLVFGSWDHQSLTVRPVALQSGACDCGACFAVKCAGALSYNHYTNEGCILLNYNNVFIYSSKVVVAASFTARVTADHGCSVKSTAGWNARPSVSKKK